jgi:cytidyltransferase-like protein
MNIYMDGVFDLFHRGHLEAIKLARKYAGENGKVIIGVVSDKDAESYKRTPIINEEDRLEIIKNIKNIDKIIFPCPLTPTKEFVENNNIDLVIHGFNGEKDWNNQKQFFQELINIGKFQNVNYYDKCSTTSIINKIKIANL